MRHWLLVAPHVARHLLVPILLLAPVWAIFLPPAVYAIPQVQDRYDKMSSSVPLANATHQMGFRYTDFANPVGSVSFEFCSNSPIVQVVCVPPTGFDISAAVLVSQSGQTGFAIDGASTTTNKLVLTRAAQTPAPASAGSVYMLSGVTNPVTPGSHYARIQTFASTDGTGLALEDGGLALAILDAFSVSSEVPPYLEFCASVIITGFNCTSATSFFIDLGELSKSSAKVASSQIVGATNAGFGYSVTLAGTTLTSGNNVIPAMAVRAGSSPGTGQFGLNLRANNNPGIGANPAGPGTASPTAEYAAVNQFKFAPGETIITTGTTSDFRKFTVSYLTNAANSQAAGVYATTVSFIALANF
ncbi:MAG TPA: hypothetical protein VK674_06435 [Candidatus Limnocylindria bacterium]|nr:hypothetical protein [Candidatus Limnocylindria bacterium]